MLSGQGEGIRSGRRRSSPDQQGLAGGQAHQVSAINRLPMLEDRGVLSRSGTEVPSTPTQSSSRRLPTGSLSGRRRSVHLPSPPPSPPVGSAAEHLGGD